jgi:hypothetical protein
MEMTMRQWRSADELLRAVAEQEAAELDRLAAHRQGVTPSWDSHENHERTAANAARSRRLARKRRRSDHQATQHDGRPVREVATGGRT